MSAPIAILTRREGVLVAEPPLRDACQNLDACGEYGCPHDDALEYPGDPDAVDA